MKKMAIKSFLASVCLLLFSCAEESEKVGQKNGSDNPYIGGAMKTWFLSTGDWGDDPQIFVREFGTGKDTVVLLHGGWGAEHSGMIDMVRGMEGEYKFFAYEQRGSLRSPFPDSLITYNHHIEDVELLRKELGVQKLTLLGHSMGAVLASAYAQKYPAHIERLVLVSPAYLKNPFPEEDIPLLRASQETYEEFSQRPEVEQELQKFDLLGNSLLSSKEETIRNRINFGQRMLFDVGKWDKLNNGRALYKGHVYGLTERTYPENGWDFIATFKTQSYPVSVIAGDHDFLDMGNRITKKWISEVPRAEFISIKDAGHLPWIDQPRRLRDVIGKSL